LHPNSTAKPSFTGFAAYRATLDVEKMKAEPSLLWLLQKPSINIWFVCSKNKERRNLIVAIGYAYIQGADFGWMITGLVRTGMS